MAFTQGKIEEGVTVVGGKEYPISSVLTQQRNRFINTPDGQRQGNVTEILIDGGKHIGVVEIGDQVTIGEITERRRKFGNIPHRQKVLDVGYEVVISSEEIR